MLVAGFWINFQCFTETNLLDSWMGKFVPSPNNFRMQRPPFVPHIGIENMFVEAQLAILFAMPCLNCAFKIHKSWDYV